VNTTKKNIVPSFLTPIAVSFLRKLSFQRHVSIIYLI
jgi:hypothetical protein